MQLLPDALGCHGNACNAGSSWFHSLLFLIDLLLHIFMHSLIDSFMCPDLGWNPQPWRSGTRL